MSNTPHRKVVRTRAIALAIESLETRLNLSGLAGLGGGGAAVHHQVDAPRAHHSHAASQEVGQLQAGSAVQSLDFGATLVAGTTTIPVTGYSAISNCQIEWQWGQTSPNVGWMSTSGSYVEYTLTVPAAGAYTLNMGLASLAGTDLNVSVNGTVTSEVTMPATGSWVAYKNGSTTVTLAAGTNVIRLTSLKGTQYNISGLSVSPKFAAAALPVGDNSSIPVASYSSIYNSQLEQQPNGAADIGWVSTSGAYVEYTVNVATAGAYTLTLGAGTTSWASFDVYGNGTKLSSFEVPNTGSWQNSTSLSQTIQLGAGTQTLRFVATNATQYNLFTINLSRQGAYGALTPPAAIATPDVSIAQRWMTSFTELDITGGSASDTIVVTQSGNTLTINANGNIHQVTGNFGDLMVSGGSGDDQIVIDSSVSVDTRVYGNAGNNTIFDATAGRATIVTLGAGIDTVAGNGVNTSYWVDPRDIVNASTAERTFGRVHVISGFYQPYSTTPGTSGYVSTSLDGPNLADPASDTSTSTRLTSNSFWGTGAVQEDVNQGQVGDCYFLAAMQSLARLQPERLREMAVDLGDGTFAVQFTRNGVTQFVRVDADLPTNSWGGLQYAHPGASGNEWVAIMEKAYAYFRTGQNSYASLNIGWTVPVYWDLGVSNATTIGLPSDQNAFYTTVNASLAKNKDVEIGTLSTISAGAPLVASHVYSVLGVTKDASGTVWVTLRNPWGIDGFSWDSKYWDGIITVSYAMLKPNASSGSILT